MEDDVFPLEPLHARLIKVLCLIQTSFISGIILLGVICLHETIPPVRETYYLETTTPIYPVLLDPDLPFGPTQTEHGICKDFFVYDIYLMEHSKEDPDVLQAPYFAYGFHFTPLNVTGHMQLNKTSTGFFVTGAPIYFADSDLPPSLICSCRNVGEGALYIMDVCTHTSHILESLTTSADDPWSCPSLLFGLLVFSMTCLGVGHISLDTLLIEIDQAQHGNFEACHRLGLVPVATDEYYINLEEGKPEEDGPFLILQDPLPPILP